MTRREAGFGWCYWAFQLLFLPAIIAAGNGYLKAPLSDVQLNFIFFGLNFICLTVILHRFLIASGKEALRHPFQTLRSAFFGFAVYYGVSFLIGMFILWLAPDFMNANDDSIAQMLQEESALTSIGIVLLVPVAEELMYRGLIFRSLYNRSRVLAYILSSLIFAAVHLVNYIPQYDPLTLALCLLQYLPAGLCLGWAYARSNTIWAPIFIHIAINQMGLLSMR